MTTLLLCVVGSVLILLEGVFLALFGLQSNVLYLSVTCVVFLALNRSISQACFMAVLWLLLAEWCAMGRTGILSMGLVVTFLMSALFRGRLEQRWGTPHLILVGCGVLVCHLLALVLSGMLSTSGAWSAAILLSVGRALAVTLICALPLGRLLLIIERRTGAKKAELGLLR